MNKVALGILISGVIGLGVFAVCDSNVELDVANTNDIGVANDIKSTGSHMKLGKIKFVDTKVSNSDNKQIISTRIKNDSDEKIKGIKYTCEIDGQVILLENNEELLPGEISDDISTYTIKTGKNIKNSKLLKAYVGVVNSNNEIENVEYLASV